MELGGLGLTRRDSGIIVGLFAVSRALYALLGLHFDASPFPSYLQFIDPALLQTRLLESLWYYHANPPLLNLLVGIGLKLFGADGATVFFCVVFHALGLLVAASVYVLAWKLSASRVTAGVVTGLLLFSPSFVLYENWLMYSFPAAGLLTISALALYQYIDTRRAGWAVAFFGLLAALLLTRSLFHPGWMVLVVALLTLILWERRRQVLVAAALPLLVVMFWLAKNYFLFGVFSSSTLMGLGLSNIATLSVPAPQLLPLVQTGELSGFALVSRYDQTNLLFSSQQLPATGIPVLDQVKKSSGQYNYNNKQMIAIDRFYTHDAFIVMRRFPAYYVIGLMISNRLFFSPTSMNLYFNAENRAATRAIERVYDPLLYGARPAPGQVQQPHFGFNGRYTVEVNTGITLVAAWFLVLGYGYVQARRAVLDRKANDIARPVVLGFIVLTALYVYVVGTTLELAENYRYRFLVEPLFFVITAVAITDLVRGLRTRLKGSPAHSAAVRP